MTIHESDTLETRVYSIAHDLSTTIHSTVAEANNHRPRPVLIVAKWNTGQTKSYFSNDLFIHSGYKLFRPATSDNFYEERGWKLLEVYEPHDRNRTSCLVIADPTGSEQRLSNHGLAEGNWPAFFQIEGICNALRLIRFLATYQDWNHLEEVKGPFLKSLQQVDLTQTYYTPKLLKGNRRVYLWKLGGFLADTHSRMSFGELSHHLTRNNFDVSHAAGEFTDNEVEVIIRDVEDWLGDEMGLPAEAMRISKAFVS